LLKLLNWVDSGAEANEVITNGEVVVNGVTELRKRNKIYPGMRVVFDGNEIEVIAG
jgi:ribosome-associated protein